MKVYIPLTYSFILLILLLSCKPDKEKQVDKADKALQVSLEQYKLENGLTVIFHIDRSDPVVAVALTSHVGSAREKEGRTGFAHLFEHLLFLESENLGKGGLDKMSARIGGSGANGSTSRDITNYYQTVPNDALEKMIWAEADKLGFFINTVTEPVLAKEKQVVKNEKMQGVDNEPYGHTLYVIDKNLYPEEHPYNWQVIGSLEDLQQATLQDVKDFYNRWYVPNNVTLVIAGDFDTVQAKTWVEKYFGEIKKGEAIPAMEKKPALLKETKKLYYEDNFANLPELTLTWPSVYEYHPDSYALQVLAQYLTEGKKAPLYKVLVEEQQLTDEVNMFNFNSEIAGQTMLSVRAFEHVNLNQVQDGITAAFTQFEKNGISDADLKRIKSLQEVAYYKGLSSVLGKAFQLAQYQIFAGDAGFINQDIKNILAISGADVMRVYNQYIKGKPYVATSFIPKGQKQLGLNNSKLAEVVEEKIVQGAEDEFILSDSMAYQRTASSFDRTKEPPYGKNPKIKVPAVWEDNLTKGLKIYGIETDEVPLVYFELVMKGGLLLEDSTKIGVSNLLAELMTKGTRNKTPEQLEEAIEELGATIEVNAGYQDITVTGSTLARNYIPTINLIQEILLEPRWDEKELALVKQKVLSELKQQEANPNDLADNQFRKAMYGDNHVLSNNIAGSEKTVKDITMDNLKKYYSTNLSPSLAVFHVVGAVKQEEGTKSLAGIHKSWEVKNVSLPEVAQAKMPEKSVIYFYDVPGSKQSVFRFGYPAPKATDPDFYPVQVMNYILGGGGFASQLTQQLREGKGYTYGIRSSFSGTDISGDFTLSTGVRSNVTYESASLIKQILEKYGNAYNENDLEVTKSFLTKSNARASETMNAKLNMLKNISSYGWPYDYARQRESIVKEMTVKKIQALAAKYVNPGKMTYLVVGDAVTQMKNLEKLGFGKPILINIAGKPQ